MKKRIATALFLAAASTASAATYMGNGGASFGGPVGGGSLEIMDDGTTLTLTLTRGPGNLNDALVLYIDGNATGVNSTLPLTDASDGGRRAISGFDGTNRTLVNFPAGFTAESALVIAGGFAFGADITNTNSNFSAYGAASSTGNASSSTRVVTFPLSVLNLAGSSFDFVGTYISETAFRSNEAIGVSDAPGGTTQIGATGTLNFSQALTYTLVPEPATLGLLVASGMVLLGRRR